MEPRRSAAGWSGKDLLGLFMLNSIDAHTPRSNTGDVSIEKHGSACTVQVTEPLPRLFNKLAMEGFSGMPVMCGSRYVGYISLLDLVKYVNGLFWGDSETDWIDYWAKSEDFAETTVGDVMETCDSWQRDPHPPMSGSLTTMYALEKMVTQNVKRIAVLNDDNRVISVLTQSMLISFLRQCGDRWSSFGNISVKSMLPDLTTPVISTLGSDIAINAFNKMEDEFVSGLAIVDNTGKLKGTISTTDLKGVGVDGGSFFRLFSAVDDFKRASRKESPDLAPKQTHFEQARTPISALFVTPEQNIKDVIELLHDGNIHRLYICNSRNKPIPTHVLTQRDVLAQALKYIIANVETAPEEEEESELGMRAGFSAQTPKNGNGKRVPGSRSPGGRAVKKMAPSPGGTRGRRRVEIK